MAALPPGDDRPPDGTELADPESYRVHIADVMRRAYELGRRYRHRGDRYARLSIVLAFAASVTGFVTAVAKNAWLGIVPGVLGAAGGAIASWMRRGHFDALAIANEQLTSELQHELRNFDAKAGVYAQEDDGSDDGGRHARRAFHLFVERSEAASLRANEAAAKREL